MSVVFYPVLAGAFRYAGVRERHAEGLLARTLREGSPLVCLLDHDPAQVVGSTPDGTLRVHVERNGLRAELDVPHTPSGRRLLTALAAGTVTGASFGFTPRRVRWHLGPQWIRELLDADVSELSVVLAPKKPANAATWAAVLGPKLHARYVALRARAGAAYRPPEVARADVTLRLAPLVLTPLLKALLGDYPTIARERTAVAAAAREHPHARTVDIVYPRPLADLRRAHARHVASISGDQPVRSGAGVKPVALPERPAIGPASSWGHGHRPSLAPKGAHVMHDDTLPELRPRPASRREIPNAAGFDGFETLRRLNKFTAELERRMPGASRWVECYRPYVDRRGVWHANPQLRATRAPLSVTAAMEHMLQKLEEHS